MMSVGDPHWQRVIQGPSGEMSVVILDSRYSRPALNGLLNTPSWRLVFADASAAVFIETGLAEMLKMPPADPEPLKNPPLKPSLL